MTRLIILAEGPTEIQFVDRVLAPHLYKFGYTFINPVPAGERRSGGVSRWGPVHREILNFLKEASDVWVTTMVDYSGMLKSWPGRREAAGMQTVGEKANPVEQAMMACVKGSLENFYPVRFVPNVTMHEFEGLLFSAPTALADAIGYPNLAPQFENILKEWGPPEEINASHDTFPSRRIKVLVPRYRKVADGVAAAQQIGLARMRQQCPLFNQWVKKLEGVA